MIRAGAAACLLALLPFLASAQAPAQPPGQPPAETAPSEPAAAAPAKPSPLEPQGYEYDPEGRRDPFISLVRRGSDVPGSAAGVRPPGLAGLATSEVSLRGTIKGREGFVGMVQGTDNKTYLVRPGDRLLDGTVRSVTADTLVILQRVNDPLTLQTEREVRKVIRQTEEAQ